MEPRIKKRLAWAIAIALVVLIVAVLDNTKNNTSKKPDTIEDIETLRTGAKYEESKNYAEAMKWFRKAAEQGSVTAQVMIGGLYLQGHGVTKDYVEAMKWFRKAADQGSAKAQVMIGYNYMGGVGVTKDYDEAMRWYRKAADQGDARGQYEYANNLHVTQYYAEAMRWYKKAADQGNIPSYVGIASLYYEGHGVTKDYDESLKWLLRAADQGNPKAMDAIGVMYEKGHGVPLDYDEAKKWHQKAFDKGFDSEWPICTGKNKNTVAFISKNAISIIEMNLAGWRNDDIDIITKDFLERGEAILLHGKQFHRLGRKLGNGSYEIQLSDGTRGMTLPDTINCGEGVK